MHGRGARLLALTATCELAALCLPDRACMVYDGHALDKRTLFRGFRVVGGACRPVSDRGGGCGALRSRDTVCH